MIANFELRIADFRTLKVGSLLSVVTKAIALCAMLFALYILVGAQHAGKLPRVGFLGNSTEALEANLIGRFREGLREVGYIESKNPMIEWRWAEGKYERFPALISELIASKIEVIVTAGPASLGSSNDTAQ